MGSSEYGGTIEFQYASDDTQHSQLLRSEILAEALADWRVFIGNPEEEALPWNTSMKVFVGDEGDWNAVVVIRWERVS